MKELVSLEKQLQKTEPTTISGELEKPKLQILLERKNRIADEINTHYISIQNAEKEKINLQEQLEIQLNLQKKLKDRIEGNKKQTIIDSECKISDLDLKGKLRKTERQVNNIKLGIEDLEYDLVILKAKVNNLEDLEDAEKKLIIILLQLEVRERLEEQNLEN